MTRKRREFDPDGDYEAQTFTLELLTGKIKLYILTADAEGNEDPVDRMMCVHVFAEGAESVKPNGTVTQKRTGRVFRYELCAACSAMLTPSPEQKSELAFRRALTGILDEPDPAKNT